jgi:hypothetical protein
MSLEAASYLAVVSAFPLSRPQASHPGWQWKSCAVLLTHLWASRLAVCLWLWVGLLFPFPPAEHSGDCAHVCLHSGERGQLSPEDMTRLGGSRGAMEARWW